MFLFIKVIKKFYHNEKKLFNNFTDKGQNNKIPILIDRTKTLEKQAR